MITTDMLKLACNLVLLCCIVGTLCDPLRSYAALGDSYATGDGAGKPQQIWCGRFSSAYPLIVGKQLHMPLKNLACGGAFVSSVLRTQAPWIGDSNLVSLQVGGNEANFFELLNECVHQWRPISTCEREMERASTMIQSSSFIDGFDSLVSHITNRLRDDAQLLVLGYASFFNDETEQCNHVSFSKTDPTSVLTNKKRKLFNNIVAMLNVVIKGAAEAHGAVYVDIDKVFEGHRFCEAGVIEPAHNSSWFFNDVDTTSGGSISGAEQIHLAHSPAGFVELTRTFHPTIEGHIAIAEEIIGLVRQSHLSSVF